PEPHAHARPPELDREPNLARANAPGDIVRLDFFGPAPMHAGGFMRHAGIGKRAPYHPRPCELLRLERRCRTNIRLGIEANPRDLKQLPNRADKRGIQVLLTEPVEACVALHAFPPVDSRAMRHRIDIDRAHRTRIRAVPTGHASIAIDVHAIGSLKQFALSRRSSNKVTRPIRTARW